MLPRAVHVLIPGTCECVTSRDRISLLGLPPQRASGWVVETDFLAVPEARSSGRVGFS